MYCKEIINVTDFLQEILIKYYELTTSNNQ
jgi:hypothetical protein